MRRVVLFQGLVGGVERYVYVDREMCLGVDGRMWRMRRGGVIGRRGGDARFDYGGDDG